MPADDPEIVVYVAIDHPIGVVQYGGTVAAPIARAILEAAIPVLGIESSTEGLSKEYNWMDTKYHQIPDVTGKSVEEAKDALKGFSIEYSGEGNTVMYQTPEPNSYVKEGGVVKLLLG